MFSNNSSHQVGVAASAAVQVSASDSASLAVAQQSRRSFMGVPRKLMQAITALVVAAIVNTSLLPLANAQQAKRAQAAQARAMEQAAAPSAAAQYQNALQTLKQNMVDESGSSVRGKASLLSGAGTDNTAPFEAAAEGMRGEWAQLNAQWKSAGVSPEILARQANLEAAFEQKHAELMALMAQPANVAKRSSLASFLADNVPQPTHHKINLDNMPWQVLKPTDQQPLQSGEALDAKLLAATVPVPAAPAMAAAANKRTTATAPALTSTPTTGQAPVDGSFLKAATAPTAADLAATVDAPQTPDIQALAISLGKNPHKIYQWVHDNIYYFPSQGSVQGAQDTLDKKTGNAFDQASLLVATLRASGIPARYVVGTVEIPADQVMNWVGGVKTTAAAQQLLGQGGVPNAAQVAGGQIKTVQLEHVWVEAYIRNSPSRGAKHSGGQTQGDSWVPMDASFKQYSFEQGMDLQAAVPLDANALVAAAQQGAEVNEAEGWVRGINSAALQTQLKAYQSQLQNYISSQNGGQSTVGNVLGSKSAQIDPLPYLAGTLPYTVRARSQQFSAIPPGYQAQFQYAIYANAQSAAWGDSPLLSWQAPTASIAGKKATIAWVAASAADQKAIEALIPTPPAGQELEPGQLPTGLSSSIHLRAEIRLEGQTVASGPAMAAGSEPVGAGSFTQYGGTRWDTTTDQLVAGQQTALGISVQGISPTQLEALKARMEATKAKLEQAQAAAPGNRAALMAGMSGEQLTGDMLTATLWGWFASLQSNGVIASAQAQTVDLPGLSYGLFHAQVKPNKIYGVVTTGIRFNGLNMDIGHTRFIRWVKNDDPQAAINKQPGLSGNGKTAAQNRWIAYNKAQGQYASAMEHAVPEQFWVDRTQCRYTDDGGIDQNQTLAACAEGISAVKAIAIAQEQGQKIYTINQSNRDTALPKLNLSGSASEEIRSAIKAGKEVTFHEKSITSNGWTGYGYVIADVETGSAAYIILGGGNGGFIMIVSLISAILIILLMGPELTAAAIAVLALLFWAAFSAFMMGLAILIKDEQGCRFFSNMTMALLVSVAGGLASEILLSVSIALAGAAVTASEDFQSQLVAKCKF